VNAVKRNTGATLASGRLWRVVCGFFALALVVTPLERAAAQEMSGQDKAALEARKEALFQQMFRDPANLDVTFAYADVSARLGDYEAAVSALERMLLFNPNLPRVQLELGALYYRMGSYELARDYFDKAAAANPPPEVRARVEQYLADVEKSQSRHHLSGYVFFGGQYQTDANVAGSSLILSPVGPVVLGNHSSSKRPGASSAAARCSIAMIWKRRTMIPWKSPASVT
jgi:tetratricopeptide (TPR) repeat protein